MSQPPNLPGTGRLKRAAASAGSSAYQGVFEAVGSILIACGIGYWIDSRYETAPFGVLGGAAIGFGAFVLRLMRLGKELHPDALAEAEANEARNGPAIDDDRGPGESPGVSELLREDPESDAQRREKLMRDKQALEERAQERNGGQTRE